MSDTTKDAVLSELREAARQFHNLTHGDPSVIIRAPSAEKRDAIIAAGERLRAALVPVQVQAEAVKAPDGWKLIPIKPDDAMQAAGAQAVRMDTTVLNRIWTANAVFRAMIEAAPSTGDQS